jgi:hypothetical protein
MIDGDNSVVRLCAEGMAIDGDPAAAAALFRQAWDARRDDYEASIAAHFLSRHQPTPFEVLHWNRIAVQHAEAVVDDRAKPLFASLYLNLGDSALALGFTAEATVAADRGVAALQWLPPDGYRQFVSLGLQRLLARIARENVP